MKRGVIVIFLICLIFVLGLIFVSAGDLMTVEANFVGYGEDMIGIQVPDYIFLGKVDKNNPFSSEEPRIRINNTGNRDIIVTPKLSEDSHEVFNYTYFRKQTSTSTNDTSLIAFHKIGEYNVDIEHGDYKTFYISLNLTDFNKNLTLDNLNLSTTIKFICMAA